MSIVARNGSVDACLIEQRGGISDQVPDLLLPVGFDCDPILLASVEDHVAVLVSPLASNFTSTGEATEEIE
jgi:hypothetical protein